MIHARSPHQYSPAFGNFLLQLSTLLDVFDRILSHLADGVHYRLGKVPAGAASSITTRTIVRCRPERLSVAAIIALTQGFVGNVSSTVLMLIGLESAGVVVGGAPGQSILRHLLDGHLPDGGDGPVGIFFAELFDDGTKLIDLVR